MYYYYLFTEEEVTSERLSNFFKSTQQKSGKARVGTHVYQSVIHETCFFLSV